MQNLCFCFAKQGICGKEEVCKLFEEEYSDIVVNFDSDVYADCSINHSSVF